MHQLRELMKQAVAMASGSGGINVGEEDTHPRMPHPLSPCVYCYVCSVLTFDLVSRLDERGGGGAWGEFDGC